MRRRFTFLTILAALILLCGGTATAAKPVFKILYTSNSYGEYKPCPS